MSLRQDVIRLVGELGMADAIDLAPYMPDATHEQIKQALQNGKWDGKLFIAVPSKWLGRAKGKTCAKYALGVAKPKPTAAVRVGPMPPNSVFQLADRMAA
jgi:hypothetical protein